MASNNNNPTVIGHVRTVGDDGTEAQTPVTVDSGITIEEQAFIEDVSKPVGLHSFRTDPS